MLYFLASIMEALATKNGVHKIWWLLKSDEWLDSESTLYTKIEDTEYTVPHYKTFCS